MKITNESFYFENFFVEFKKTLFFVILFGFDDNLFQRTIFFSFFLSDTTLEKLAHSQYLQSKITKVLEDNAISSKGIKSIKFNEFNSADINIEKAKISGLNDVWLRHQFKS